MLFAIDRDNKLVPFPPDGPPIRHLLLSHQNLMRWSNVVLYILCTTALIALALRTKMRPWLAVGSALLAGCVSWTVCTGRTQNAFLSVWFGLCQRRRFRMFGRAVLDTSPKDVERGTALESSPTP